jgi:3-hydroxy-9,10-secoandrosta-1,3,5(10)-triene-9,17-dione monooxygenase reductase component
MSGSFHALNLDPLHPRAVAAALSQIPSGLYILTSHFEEARTGMLITQVQQCSSAPPLVLFAIAKGQPIEPLIRDSRSFALCQIHSEDLLMRKIFEPAPDHGADPFISLPIFTSVTGSPILDRSIAWLDCELVRHLDVETSTSIYIGAVRIGGVRKDTESPAPKPVAKSNGHAPRPNTNSKTNGHPKSNGHSNGNGHPKRR